MQEQEKDPKLEAKSALKEAIEGVKGAATLGERNYPRAFYTFGMYLIIGMPVMLFTCLVSGAKLFWESLKSDSFMRNLTNVPILVFAGVIVFWFLTTYVVYHTITGKLAGFGAENLR